MFLKLLQLNFATIQLSPHSLQLKLSVFQQQYITCVMQFYPLLLQFSAKHRI